MTNIQQTQSRPAGDTRQPDSSGKWYIDPVTHKLIVPDIDKCRPKLPNLTEIKARMTAKLKPDMFPELRDQVKKLVGDAVSVRDTIQEAFHKDFLKGFDALASACLAVADVEMCQCLVVAWGNPGGTIVRIAGQIELGSFPVSPRQRRFDRLIEGPGRAPAGETSSGF